MSASTAMSTPPMRLARLVAAMAVLATAAPASAQTYTRCVDTAGRIYLTDGALPADLHCVAQATKELRETTAPVEKAAAPPLGQHVLWMTEPSGTILVRAYPTEGACRASRDARATAAAQRTPLDITYRCLPAGTRP